MAESVLKIGAEAPKENRLGLKALDYGGGKSTLCAGCGHDAVSNQIIRAFYEMNVKPEMVAKFSGIGCSSKTPAYFLNRAHGFNAVHGRMPAVAVGDLGQADRLGADRGQVQLACGRADRGLRSGIDGRRLGSGGHDSLPVSRSS